MDVLDLYPTPLKYAKNVACDDFRDEIDAPNRYALLEKALKNLPPREEFILRRRWFNGFSLKAIGKLVGISLGRVRQIELKALRRIRHPKLSSAEIRNTDSKWRVEAQREAALSPSEKYAEDLRNYRKNNPPDTEEVIFRNRLAWMKKKKHGALQLVRCRRQTQLLHIQADREVQRQKEWEDHKADFRRRNPRPPYYIQLGFDKYKNPYLWCNPRFGKVERSIDPECYDMWLNHLLREHDDKLKQHEEVAGHITCIEQLPRSIFDSVPFSKILRSKR